MILIDVNSSLRRHHSVAVSNTLEEFKKRFEKDNSETTTNNELYEYTYMFLTLSIQEILYFRDKFKSTYGEIVLASDSGNVWRRRVYERYKVNRRKEKKPFDDFVNKLFYKVQPIFDKLIDNTRFIHIKDLKTEDGFGVEADDIIGHLALTVKTQKHVIVGVDQDYIQVLNENVKQYNPMKKVIIPTPAKRDVKMWIDVNTVAGQSKDGIPAINHETKMSKDFIGWMQEKYDLDIANISIDKIENEHKHFMDEYEVEKAIEDIQLIDDGKRKQKRNLTAYEKPKLGKVGALKILNDLDGYLELNERYSKNYQRNRDLLLFENIPDDVSDVIMTAYKLEKTKKNELMFNSLDFIDLLNKYRLYSLVEKVDKF